MRITIAFLLLCCSLGSFGQTLQVFNYNQVKTFKPTSYYEIVTAANNSDCDWAQYLGRITQISVDSLVFQATSIKSRKMLDATAAVHTQQFPHNAGQVSLAHNDILFLRHYRSEKAFDRRKAYSIIGGLLLFTGAATAIHGLLIDDKPSRKTLFLSGGIQCITGLVFGISSSPPRYYLRDREKVWWIRPVEQ